MFEVILEVIVHFFVEIIFEGIILGIFRVVKLIGLLVLKMVTLSDEEINELNKKYKDSSKPYFLGLGVIVVIILLGAQIF